MKDIPISDISADPDNPRKEITDIEEFSQSLEILPSIEQPIIVSHQGGKGYRVIDGERRYRAALKAGFESVWCDIREGLSSTDKAILRLRLDSNNVKWRKLERVLEVERTFKAWSASNSHKSNKQREFAKLIGLKEKTLSEMLAIASDPVALHELRTGKIFENAVTVSRIKEPERKQELLSTAKEFVAHEFSRPNPKHEIPLDTMRRVSRVLQTEHEESDEKREARAMKYILEGLQTSVDPVAEIRREIKMITDPENVATVATKIDRTISAYQELKSDLSKQFPSLTRKVQK